MAQVYKTFDITLTQEFTAYLQNLINAQWEGETVVYPALAVKTIVPTQLGGNDVRILTVYWNGLQYVGYSLPIATSTTIRLDATEDPQEIEPPTLTGHLLLIGTYSTDPGTQTYTFEILAVREEDFTPEVS